MLSCWKYWYWCMLLLLLAGCMTTETHMVLPDTLAPVTALPVHPDEYQYLAWMDAEQLVTHYNPGTSTSIYTVRIGRINVQDGSIHPLDVPPHPQCTEKPYMLHIPTLAPHSQITYLCSCSETQFGQDFDYPMFYNPQTDIAHPARSGKFDPVTTDDHIGGVRSYSFFPDMQTGILVDSWTGARQLHTFDATSVTQVDLGVDGVGTAALSPDGTNLLITTQQGKKGIGMLDEPYQIELVDPTTWERRPLFSGYNAASITWSPDSKYTVIGTSIDAHAQTDLWLINTTTGKRRRIGSDSYGHTAWSPDGTTLAATRFVSSAPLNSLREIVLLDLTQVELP